MADRPTWIDHRWPAEAVCEMLVDERKRSVIGPHIKGDSRCDHPRCKAVEVGVSIVPGPHGGLLVGDRLFTKGGSVKP